jgi:hypothetical protein
VFSPKGLEDQLLAELVRQERPELEEQRDRLVVSLAADKRQLKELEDKVLKLLKEASGNILDDEVVINTLNHTKTTSGKCSGPSAGPLYHQQWTCCIPLLYLAGKLAKHGALRNHGSA